jgi:transcription initiation factor TFIIIB Brf1 subunit/transcription initiation factor TFIIB
MNKQNTIKPKCSICRSTLIYIRIKTNEKVCRNCGLIEKLKGGKAI